MMRSVLGAPSLGRREWLLANHQKTITMWPTLMAIFNFLTLFERHTGLYHFCSLTCLINALALRYYAIKRNVEAVRWLFLSFGSLQIFFFLQFSRQAGDVCPPVHYYADPITNLYTVVPQLIMSDLPLLPFIMFRTMHMAGSVSLYFFVVGHSLKLAILRALFIHGCVCGLGYEYVARKIHAAYMLHLARKQQLKEAGLTPWADQATASKAAASMPAGLPPKPLKLESPDTKQAAPSAAGPPSVPMLATPVQGLPKQPALHQPSAAVLAFSASAGMPAARGPEQLGQEQQLAFVEEELEASVNAIRSVVYRSRLKRTKATLKIYAEVEPETLPEDLCTSIVAALTHRLPGSFAIDAAVRHGCVVLSLEWACTKEAPAPLGLDEQQVDTGLEHIQEAAKQWASLALHDRQPLHGMELTVQVQGGLHRCSWDAGQQQWVLAHSSGDSRPDPCSTAQYGLSLPCVAIPLPQAPGAAKPAAEQGGAWAGPGGASVDGALPDPHQAEVGTVRVHVQALVHAPAAGVVVRGWNTEARELEAGVGQQASSALGTLGVDGQQQQQQQQQQQGKREAQWAPQQLQILARGTGEFLALEVVRAEAAQCGQAMQVSLALHLPRAHLAPASSPFARVSLELWHGNRLLASAPLVLVPAAAQAMAHDLDSWCAGQPRGAQLTEFVEDIAFWLSAQRVRRGRPNNGTDCDDTRMLAALGLDLLDHVIREGLVEVADTVLELLLAGPYNLEFMDIAFGGIPGDTVEREQLVHSALMSGKVAMVERVLAWEHKHSSRCVSQASSCSSSSATSSCWRWDVAGPTGITPLQVLCSLPAPIRKQVQQLMPSEFCMCDDALARALVGMGLATATPVPGSGLSSRTLSERPSEAPAPAAPLPPPCPAGVSCRRALRAAAGSWAGGGFPGQQDEAAYCNWRRQAPLATTSRCLPVALYLVLCAAVARSAATGAGWAASPGGVRGGGGGGSGGSGTWLACLPASTLVSTVPAWYLLLQLRSPSPPCRLSRKQCLMVCAALALLLVLLHGLEQPLLLHLLAAMVSLAVSAALDVGSRCAYLYHRAAAAAAGAMELKKLA